MKLPDCESPIAMAWSIAPGDRVRRAGGVRRGVAEERDDVARRGQADAEHQRVLGRVGELVEPAGSKPSFTQTRVGSGVPGNGAVRQSANAQSARGTRGRRAASCTPS